MAAKHRQDEDEDILTDIAQSIREEERAVRAYEEAKNSGHKADEEKEEADDRISSKKLLIVLAVVALAFIIPLVIMSFQKSSARALTIDELHQKNIEGDLDPEQGYIYNGFSFINYAGLWHSQIQKGSVLYDITFNYDPRSVENVTVEGALSTRFDNGNRIYITFDQNATGLKYLAVANAGLSMSLAKGFQYNISAGCTSNESGLCRQKGVITCEDKEKAVIYLKESLDTKIVLSDNCVVIQGYGPDMIRAKDRLLMRWYGVMI